MQRLKIALLYFSGAIRLHSMRTSLWSLLVLVARPSISDLTHSHSATESWRKRPQDHSSNKL